MDDLRSTSSAKRDAPVSTGSDTCDHPENPRPKNYFYPADPIHFGEACLHWYGVLGTRYDPIGEIITPRPFPAIRSQEPPEDQPPRQYWGKYGTLVKTLVYRPKLSMPRFLEQVANKWDAEFAVDYLKKAEGESLPNPFASIPEVLQACDRLQSAADLDQQILIYGDYDCDGVVSTTLMTQALHALKIPDEQILRVLPHRIKDGYNLNWKVLERRIKEANKKVSLIIAVDCGSTAVDAAQRIRKAGMDLLVVDHHNLDAAHALPPTDQHLIHINPKLWMGRAGNDPRYRLEYMCASGLVYLLARTLASRCPAKNSWSHPQAALLAGLATCVDVMKLTGFNRLLLKESLRLANQPEVIEKIPALAELKKQKGPKDEDMRPVTEQDYGMSWGPVINAPGRMATAELALDFILAKTAKRARELFKECDKMNRFRKATERAMLHEAHLLLGDNHKPKQSKTREEEGEENSGTPDALPPVLVVSHPHWHPGVVGILASRLRERHLRPTVVNTLHLQEEEEGEKWVGSGRSINNNIHPLDLGSAFHALVDGGKILKGGGHPMAGGLSFAGNQKESLAANLIEAYRVQVEQHTKDHDPKRLIPSDHEQNRAPERLIVEVGAAASDFKPDRWANIFEKMRPFGNGNPCPPLLVEAAELLSVDARTTNRFAPLGRPDFGGADESDENDEPEASGKSDQADGRGDELKRKKPRTIKEDAAWLLTVDSILKSKEKLISRLYHNNHRDPAARWVRSKLSEQGIAALRYCHQAEKQEDTTDHLAILVENLNQILLNSSLYSEEVFKGIKLRTQTRHLLAQNLGNIRMLELNRLLFEDAFPKIAKVKDIRMPKICAYTANFEDKISGEQIKVVWTDLEKAEVMWQPNLFILARHHGEKPPRLPRLFRLQLALQAYIDSQALSDIYQGRKFQRRHLFQVLQCEALPWDTDPRRMRMPVMRRPKESLVSTLRLGKCRESQIRATHGP